MVFRQLRELFLRQPERLPLAADDVAQVTGNFSGAGRRDFQPLPCSGPLLFSRHTESSFQRLSRMNVTLTQSFRLLVAPLLAVALSSQAPAEDEKIPELTTASGKTYHGVTVTKTTPTEVSILHETGTARIPFADLPEDLKAKLGYDSAKAQAHLQAAANAAAAVAKQNAEAVKKAADLSKSSQLIGEVFFTAGDVAITYAPEPVPYSDSGIVASSSQSSGMGGGYYAPRTAETTSKPKDPPRPRIYGTFAVVGVPALSKIADRDKVRWLVVPTGEVRRIGEGSYKVCQYIGSDK